MVLCEEINKYHRPVTAEELYRTYDYLDSSGKVFDSTRKIFTDDKKERLQLKLQGVFGYTNISRASLFQEEKYMNLWIALESLSRTKMYGDIISNIKEILPAALCLRYLYRKIENHHRKIEWQVQRLYRFRNEVAHTALQENTSLIIYIEHL